MYDVSILCSIVRTDPPILAAYSRYSFNIPFGPGSNWLPYYLLQAMRQLRTVHRFSSWKTWEDCTEAKPTNLEEKSHSPMNLKETFNITHDPMITLARWRMRPQQIQDHVVFCSKANLFWSFLYTLPKRLFEMYISNINQT